MKKFEEEPYGLRILGRIVNVLADESEGKVDAEKLHAFAFDQMRNGYYAGTGKVGQAWNSGAGLMKK